VNLIIAIVITVFMGIFAIGSCVLVAEKKK